MHSKLLKLIILTSIALSTSIYQGYSHSSSKRVYRIFVLTPGTDPYDPLNYTETTTVPTCPANGNVCAIAIMDSDVYTVWDAPILAYAGKPKVDIATGNVGELSDDIAYALQTTGEGSSPWGRIIYEKL
uniref:hypothetical protein n=1 Tax=Pedobacter schmidteae TaxID=2201271 RepID=UPI0013CEF4D1|nr:hypothetical protein [Pedobacter schmidteae]